MKKIKGVLFDMDGTLTDTEIVYSRSIVMALKEQNLEPQENILDRVRGVSNQNFRKIVLSIYGDNIEYDRFHKSVMDNYSLIKEKEGVKLKSGAKELLDFLRESGIKTAVATSTVRESAEHTLKYANIKDYFDEIITGDMVTNGKPAPDIFVKAAMVLGLTPDECMGIEDSANGIRACLASGVYTVFVRDLIDIPEELLEQVNLNAVSLFEVIDIIKHINMGE